MGKITSFH